VVPAPAATASGSDWSTVLLAFLGAVLGGLILNVMPCVFPILSLKALSLARAGGDERAARHDALAYAAGAIAVCFALGVVILTLRAGGSAVGWAFQLQDPHVVILLLVLTVAIALNLAGVFEVPVPGFVNRTGGASGAFATGALAAFVATPCAGPFLGAALGTALLLPVAGSVLVFAALGLGLAIPFVAIAFVPALRNRLPRPGPWMRRLQRVLAIPMALSALAALWLLYRQAGSPGLLLGAAGAIGLALLLFGAGQRQRSGGRVLWAVPAALAMAALLIVVMPPRSSAEARGQLTDPTWSEADPLQVFRGSVENGLTSCADIADEMDVSKGYVSKLAKRAETAGWLKIEKREYRIKGDSE